MGRQKGEHSPLFFGASLLPIPVPESGFVQINQVGDSTIELRTQRFKRKNRGTVQSISPVMGQSPFNVLFFSYFSAAFNLLC